MLMLLPRPRLRLCSLRRIIWTAHKKLLRFERNYL
jgi:hypothetical protein